MTINDKPTVFLKSSHRPGQTSRLFSSIVLISGLAACAATTPVSDSPGEIKPDISLSAAHDMYNSSDYSGATKAFDKIIADKQAGAHTHRLAHLGKAMIYLGNDTNWHSLENAKMSLMAAGQVASKGPDNLSVETDLLIKAVSAVIGTESKYAVLLAKSGGSGAQNMELRRELDTLKAERVELLAEQKVLNEALQKLKELTLGD